MCVDTAQGRLHGPFLVHEGPESLPISPQGVPAFRDKELPESGGLEIPLSL